MLTPTARLVSRQTGANSGRERGPQYAAPVSLSVPAGTRPESS